MIKITVAAPLHTEQGKIHFLDPIQIEASWPICSLKAHKEHEIHMIIYDFFFVNVGIEATFGRSYWIWTAPNAPIGFDFPLRAAILNALEQRANCWPPSGIGPSK